MLDKIGNIYIMSISNYRTASPLFVQLVSFSEDTSHLARLGT